MLSPTSLFNILMAPAAQFLSTVALRTCKWSLPWLDGFMNRTSIVTPHPSQALACKAMDGVTVLCGSGCSLVCPAHVGPLQVKSQCPRAGSSDLSFSLNDCSAVPFKLLCRHQTGFSGTRVCSFRHLGNDSIPRCTRKSVGRVVRTEMCW